MKFKTVDEYIAQAPEESRARASELRALIKQTLPKVEEKISYQMPYYSYCGRLLYFAAYKTYIGVYLMSEAREAHKDELERYHTSKATYKFPLTEELPQTLLKKIINTQASANNKGEK